jgi:hypothetical protein
VESAEPARGLDPSSLGVFFDAAAFPSTAEVDARTLLTLASNTGFDPMLEAEIRALIP